MAQQPHVASFYDTGSYIYNYLRIRGFLWAGQIRIPHSSEVNHLHGVTRKLLYPHSLEAASLDQVEATCLDRLFSAYPDLFAGFSAAIDSAKHQIMTLQGS
jgi:hypothetical protein